MYFYVPVKVVDLEVSLSIGVGFRAFFRNEQRKTGVHKRVELETVSQRLSDTWLDQKHVADSFYVIVHELVTRRTDKLSQSLELLRGVQFRVENIWSVYSDQNRQIWFLSGVLKLF